MDELDMALRGELNRLLEPVETILQEQDELDCRRNVLETIEILEQRYHISLRTWLREKCELHGKNYNTIITGNR